MRRLTDGTAASRVTLALDLVALPVFVLVGMVNHEDGWRTGVFLRNAVPVVAAWVAVSWVVGTYRPPTLVGMVKTWAIALPIGLAVRTAIAGTLDDPDVLVFVGVAMAFTLLFLGIARAVSILATSRMGGGS